MEGEEGFCLAVISARCWTSLKSRRVEDISFFFEEGNGERDFNDWSSFGMDIFSSSFFWGFFKIDFKGKEEGVRRETECFASIIFEGISLSF